MRTAGLALANSPMALALAISQTIITLLLFGLFLGIRRLFERESLRIRPDGLSSYEVFHRDGKWSALRSDQSFQFRAALFYAGFFYLWVPALAYRYGWAKAVFLVALPFAGIPIGALIASNYGEPSASILAGMVLVAFIRSALSIQVGISSMRWMREAKISRGWTLVGQCSAIAATEAIRFFNPPQPKSESTNLFKQLPRFFDRAR